MNIGARMWRFIYYHKSISLEWKLPQKLSERINAMNSCSVTLLLFVLALIWAANVRQKSACSYMPNLWDFFCLFNLYLVKFVWRNCCWNKIWIDKIISVLFEKKAGFEMEINFLASFCNSSNFVENGFIHSKCGRCFCIPMHLFCVDSFEFIGFICYQVCWTGWLRGMWCAYSVRYLMFIRFLYNIGSIPATIQWYLLLY